MHYKGASDFYLDSFYHFLNTFDLVNLSCATYLISKYRKVVSSRPVYYLIFEHVSCTTNLDVLLTKGYCIEGLLSNFLNFSGVLLTEACYNKNVLLLKTLL